MRAPTSATSTIALGPASGMLLCAILPREKSTQIARRRARHVVLGGERREVRDREIGHEARTRELGRHLGDERLELGACGGDRGCAARR